MGLKCRLCGVEKPSSELVITLQSESQKVTLIDLVEYFCRIRLDRDKKLSQEVCKVCKVSLESFMYFCDTIEKHQKSLLSVKNEKAKSNAIVIQEEIPQEQPEFVIDDADLLHDLFEDENDEDLDSPVSNVDTESTISESTSLNLRKKTLPLKEMSVFLERLNIIYEPSDTESESDESEDEENMVKGLKRRRLSGSAEISPSSKRMRISPIKLVGK